VVSELLLSDMAHACVEKFHHSQITVTDHCGLLRNKLAVKNSVSTEKKKRSVLS